MENNKEKATLFLKGNPIITMDKEEILKILNRYQNPKEIGYEMLKNGETPKYIKKKNKEIQIVKLFDEK